MRIFAHTDEKITELTPFVTRFKRSHSLSAPFETLSCALKLPENTEILPRSSTGEIDLDMWIVLRNNEGDLLFVGPLDSVSRGIRALTGTAPDGQIITNEVLLNCSSWVSVMMSGQVVLNGSSVLGLEGHVYTLQNWREEFRTLLRGSVQSGEIGSVLAKLWRLLAEPYRFPKTFANGATFGASVEVAFNTTTARELAVERVKNIDPVEGIAINAQAQGIPRGTAWSILSSIFDIDPNLVELFSGVELPRFGGARPVLHYRMRPFDGGYQAPTKNITLTEITEIGYSQSDGDRINGCWLDNPLVSSEGIEAFGLGGSPQFEEADIEKRGLRIYRGNWPFFPKKDSVSVRSQMQALIDKAGRMLLGGHKYSDGTISTRHRPDIRAGEWVQIDGLSPKPYLCYVLTAVHSVRAESRGQIHASSDFSFMRGSFI